MSDTNAPADKAGDADRRTVRGIPNAQWNQAVAAAARADVTVGEWLTRAIDYALRAEREAAPGFLSADARASGLADVERIAGHIRDLSAAGVPISDRVSRRIYNALIGYLPKGEQPKRPKLAPPSPP